MRWLQGATCLAPPVGLARLVVNEKRLVEPGTLRELDYTCIDKVRKQEKPA